MRATPASGSIRKLLGQLRNKAIFLRDAAQRMAISEALFIQLLLGVSSWPDAPTIVVDHIRDHRLLYRDATADLQFQINQCNRSVGRLKPFPRFFQSRTAGSIKESMTSRYSAGVHSGLICSNGLACTSGSFAG